MQQESAGGGLTGLVSVQGFARELAEEVRGAGFQAEVIDMKDYDPDDRLAEEVSHVSAL